MRRRSRLEIYLDLIRAVSQHRNPKRIVEKVNLPLSDAERHLDFLASQGFVRTIELGNGGAEYELAQKGSEMLEVLQELEGLKPSISTKISA